MNRDKEVLFPLKSYRSTYMHINLPKADINCTEAKSKADDLHPSLHFMLYLAIDKQKPW
jgi:hypothetical protein